MSARGSARGSSRGRVRGRGRGRGRGPKMMIWEWEKYTPGPEVYNELWHIRRAPGSIVPRLPNDCPIPLARSRILDRRQTEDGFNRHYYVVEVTHEAQPDIEMVMVDMSAIMEYVSPRELERFEDGQFKAEGEAEAAARRAEAQELVQRRLRKNARGYDAQMPIVATRGRGRPRGRGRGRGRPRGASILERTVGGSSRDKEDQDEPTSGEDGEILVEEEDGEVEPVILETESEEEEMGGNASQIFATSPGIQRSSFLANSALPVTSPTIAHRGRPSVLRGHPEVPDIGDLGLHEEDEGSTSESYASAAEIPYSRGDDSQVSEDRESVDLTAADKEPLENNDTGEEDEEEYVVEDILAHVTRGGIKHYLVKWEGYENSTDWLPEADLVDAADVVTEYNERLKRKEGKKRAT